MKKFLCLSIITLLVSLLGACASDVSDSEQARKSLVAFFEYLNQGEYDQAVELYGGSYEVLVNFNPSLDPEDLPALLENGCEINGLQCLAVQTADFKVKNAKGEYVFVVQFKDADGKLFVQQMSNAPPVFIFEYRVMKGEDGKFRVLDLPVYLN